MMVWRTTADAPPREWRWDDATAEQGDIGAEEHAACEAVDRAIRSSGGGGITGMTVLELGCGRGACLRWARAHGARRLVGVDRAAGALRATRLCLGPGVDLVRADATDTAIPSCCADLVWSHGVVEHLRPGELKRYLAEAVRLSRQWVAFSAPNPACTIYAAFRATMLAMESWEWGYEEPLPSYAPSLHVLGCEVVLDEDVGRDWRAMAPYAARLPDQAAWRLRIERGEISGIYSVVVARVPA